MPTFGKDAEELELSYTADKNVKWYTHFEKLSLFLRMLNTSSLYACYSTPRYLLKINESICVYCT